MVGIFIVVAAAGCIAWAVFPHGNEPAKEETPIVVADDTQQEEETDTEKPPATEPQSEDGMTPDEIRQTIAGSYYVGKEWDDSTVVFYFQGTDTPTKFNLTRWSYQGDELKDAMIIPTQFNDEMTTIAFDPTHNSAEPSPFDGSQADKQIVVNDIVFTWDDPANWGE